jgi:alpha-tubulin suppressor-like RCC1 family protein
VSEFKYDDTVWQSAVFNEMGTKTVTAMAFLKNGHVVSDTVSLSIYPRPVPNHPPVWQKDTINIVGNPGIPISITLSDKCSDPDHDSLTFSLLTGTPAGDTITSAATYVFTPGGTDTGMFYPRVVAKDPKGAADTLIVALSIHPLNIDSLPPVMKLVIPSHDSVSVNSNSLTVKIFCTDPSGVAKVRCLMAADSFPVIHADSTYSAAVTGLKQGVYNTIAFIAIDSSSRANKDTLFVHVKYDSIIVDKTPPGIRLLSPVKDSTSVAGNATMIQVICKDASGIASVTCTMGAALFPVNKSATADSIWSATITGLAPGQFSALTIVAVDSSLSANKDTLVLRIKYDNDTIAPTITRLDPAKDSMSVNSNSYYVKVVCKDPSSVASVVYAIGSANFPAVKSFDTIWSATITGLTPSAFSKIAVIATDGSLRANKDTMALSIKFDSTITDLVGPIFYQKTGPANNAIVSDSGVTIVDSIYDPSGVDSVYWTLNGKNPKPLTIVSGKTNLYSLIDTLRRFHLDTIVIFGQDKSTNRNKSSQTIVLNFNVPPVINDTSVSTNRNVAKTWALNFQSIDGDPLTWSRLTSPSALSGTITGTLPSATFTPAANWAGADSFLVRVTDGYWSDTAKIKMTVVDVSVAPTITTQPAGATKNVGQTVTFSVGINADVNPTPTYQWKHNGTAITSANQASFTIGSIAIADSGSYTVTVINGAGTVTSSAAILKVNFAPTITMQPVSQTLYLNQPATFTVTAVGYPTPTYIWKKNGVAISGQTGASLTISTPGISDSGKYSVTVTNSISTVTSDTARFCAIIKSISAGGSHSLFLKTDGRVFACGNNSNGQLGNGSTNNDSIPRQIMTDVQAIAAGAAHSLILKTNGTLFACGYNTFGQLGDGTTNDQHSPVQITTGVQAIAAGGYHSLILKTNGILFACGTNSFGQLGDGTTSEQHSPVQIMTEVQAIAAGDVHSLILKTNATLFASGFNGNGQLGDGTIIDQHSPEQIMTGVQAIAAGGSHSLILKSNGTLFACGNNGNGQLGDGTTSDQHSPEQIMTGVQAIAAGGSHSLILQSNGTLFACGNNGNGQLGDGTTIDQHSSVQIMTDVQAIAAGGYHSLILKTKGILFACGDNGKGQIGDGTSIGKHIPVQILF